MIHADDYMPPHSQESEQGLIGAILLDNRAFDRIAGRVEPEDCFSDSHKVILQSIIRLLERGKSADVVTVFEDLQTRGESDRVGGLAYLGELANSCPGTSGIVRYAEVVQERATLRALMAAASGIHEIATSADGMTTTDRVSASAELIASVVESGVRTRSEPIQINDCILEVLECMETSQDGNEYRSYKTGIPDLDDKLYDLVPGALIIIAGRPGMGKSSLALAIADTVSADSQPGAVGIFSLEMPKKQITYRLVSRNSGVSLPRLMEAKHLTSNDYTAITAATGAMYARDLWIDDTPAIRITDLRARCNMIRRKKGLKLIVVDYLQLMTGNGDNRTQEIGGISRGLKALAKEFGVPVIALSQLNRSLEQRADKRPVMSDLRESGDIEQDADLIVFCYRDEVYHPDSQDRGTAELIIGKQRNGPTGICRAAWNGETATFRPLDMHAYMQAKADQPQKPAKPRVRGFD